MTMPKPPGPFGAEYYVEMTDWHWQRRLWKVKRIFILELTEPQLFRAIKHSTCVDYRPPLDDENDDDEECWTWVDQRNFDSLCFGRPNSDTGLFHVLYCQKS